MRCARTSTFVAAKDEYAVFAIELDSDDHWADAKIAARDRKKQEICDLFEFPMLRVTQRLMMPLFMHGVLGLVPFMWYGEQEGVDDRLITPEPRVAEAGCRVFGTASGAGGSGQF